MSIGAGKRTFYTKKQAVMSGKTLQDVDEEEERVRTAELEATGKPNQKRGKPKESSELSNVLESLDKLR